MLYWRFTGTALGKPHRMMTSQIAAVKQVVTNLQYGAGEFAEITPVRD